MVELENVFMGGCVIFATVLVLLHQFQEKLLYHPIIPGASKKPADNPRGYRSPAEYNIDFEDIYCTTDDGAIVHSWVLKQRQSNSKPTILFFHGNAGNIGFRLPNAVSMFEKTGANIVMVDYRGYGNSVGEPTEIGLMLDATVVLDHVRNRSDLDPRNIIVFGRSLGGAVALALADRESEKIRAVVLENTFLSIGTMVDHLMPLLSYFKRLVLRMNWDNYNIIPRIGHPILFFAGEQDELVPHAHMVQLYKLAVRSSLKRWVPIKNGTHNDTWVRGGSNYLEELAAFIAECTNNNKDGSDDSCKAASL